jgi:hypothetical protein
MSEIASPIVSQRPPFLQLAVSPRPRHLLNEALRPSRDCRRHAEPDRVIGNEHALRALYQSKTRSIALMNPPHSSLALLESP